MTPIPATPRRALLYLKWTMVDAIERGATIPEIIDELGKPWTPELFAQCFPDVTRRTEAA